nr:immunoglobulin light chain junction region [Macaca mulatta]
CQQYIDLLPLTF